MTREPGRYGAVAADVPVADLLRFPAMGAGASYVGEYGDPARAEDRAWLAKLSPYHALSRGVAYPPVLLTTATADDRVGPGHSRKFAARMREFGRPVLFVEETGAGHAGGGDLRPFAEAAAREAVFLSRALGLE